MPLAKSKTFNDICTKADVEGWHVCLVSGNALEIRPRPDGGTSRWREITSIEVMNKKGEPIAVVPMKGISDLDRAAKVLYGKLIACQ